MCDIELDGNCEVWQEWLIKKARKQHRCDLCHGRIEIGTSYWRHFSIYERDVTDEKMCVPCQIVVEEFHEAHRTRSNPSYMRELFRECVDQETIVRGMGQSKTHELSPQGQRWQTAIDAMKARERAAKVPA